MIFVNTSIIEARPWNPIFLLNCCTPGTWKTPYSQKFTPFHKLYIHTSQETRVIIANSPHHKETAMISRVFTYLCWNGSMDYTIRNVDLPFIQPLCGWVLQSLRKLRNVVSWRIQDVNFLPPSLVNKQTLLPALSK